ncbi:ABC transporter substrate-binding protein [Capillibacterium thermochitinicola]|uniref:ABC transporter substrate-binding protein n=1 Tax=Capillibacterium thermochitinicola TaxID=2699427 RepID=A0A8J6HS73_9FIRM|nr:ABC transporter substrate-binding protein [Capillibacterium thermochitinicola]MBA2133161.1 ABC transporter substrate-binding protein [Capillibacterium thermochitinicola]
MKKKLVLLLVAAVLLLGGVLFWTRPVQSRTVTLAMTYIPNVQFAPWYVAEEKGYFREEGLEVVFDYRMDIDALQLVATGKMDYAIAGGDQVLVARGQGIPVVYLMSLYAEFPPAVIAKAETGIKTATDLKGKTVGLPLYGTNLLAVQAILRRAGLAEKDVHLVDIGYTQIPSLLEDKVDAVVGFANNEPIKLKAMGVAVNQINSWDYFSLVGHGLITGAGKVEKAPAEVGKMVRASYKGLQYALAHPEEAFAICLKYLPELGEEQKKQEWEVLKASMALWENDYTRTYGLGRSDPASWEDAQQLMIELGMIPQATPVGEILNLSFLPE